MSKTIQESSNKIINLSNNNENETIKNKKQSYLNNILDEVKKIENEINPKANTIQQKALLKELNMVYGSHDVNYHHLSILVDTMVNNGKLVSMDRHGITKLDTDPLSRASFEMPMEQLTKAAMFCEVDHMRSVSSRIMAGRVISGGSGLCDVLLDVDMIQKSEYIEDLESIYRSNFISFEKNSILDDIMTRQIMEIFKPN